jgi:uncharacterized protein GlcG (DUF336 family)
MAADLTEKKALTLAGAKHIAAAAEAEAVKNNWNVVIAIVDEGGYLVYLQKMDASDRQHRHRAARRAVRLFAVKLRPLRNSCSGRVSVQKLEAPCPWRAGFP